MKPRFAKKRFLEILDDAGQHLKTLEPATGIDLMLGYYRDERADGCVIEEDGDMLLVQWGDFDEGVFEFDITRQFIDEEAEDENIRQLSLTFAFKQTDALRKIVEGNRWCHSPMEIAEFRAFILASAVFSAVSQLTPKRVFLELEVAG